MILCLNIGNTQIHGGVFIDEELVLQFRHAVYVGITSDQLGLFLKEVLTANELNSKHITEIAYCSVTPYLDYPLRSACIKYFKKDPFVLQAGVKTGLKIKYHNPLEVGADRIANAIAAITLFPNQPIIITEFGLTATVICVINKQHEYLGGNILPGLLLSVDALQQQAAKLPPVLITKPETVIGRTTVNSIQSGLFYGQLGAAREIIHRIKVEAFKNENHTVMTIVTGAFSHLFAAEDLFNIAVPNLSLQGLRITLLKNKKTEKQFDSFN